MSYQIPGSTSMLTFDVAAFEKAAAQACAAGGITTPAQFTTAIGNVSGAAWNATEAAILKALAAAITIT